MRSKTISLLTVLALATIFLSACSAMARHHNALIGHDPANRSTTIADNTDPISGEWNVTFFVHDSKNAGDVHAETGRNRDYRNGLFRPYGSGNHS